MRIDFRRNNSQNVSYDLDFARQLSKKMTAKNKQMKVIAGYVRQFDQVFADQNYLMSQLSNQIQRIRDHRSKDKSPQNISNIFKSKDSKIEKLKQKIPTKSCKRSSKLSQKTVHSKTKSQQDEICFKLPKLTPQKKSVLNFQEEMFAYKQQSPFSEKKIIKMPIERLVPLSYEDIRKRIESKLV